MNEHECLQEDVLAIRGKQIEELFAKTTETDICVEDLEKWKIEYEPRINRTHTQAKNLDEIINGKDSDKKDTGIKGMIINIDNSLNKLLAEKEMSKKNAFDWYTWTFRFVITGLLSIIIFKVFAVKI